MKGSLTNERKEQTHVVELEANHNYVIEMQSKQFDTFLRLEDDKGKQLAKNDDVNTKRRMFNSRIEFTSKQTGKYRIVATSYQQRGRGRYTILIREFKDQD